MKRYFTLVGQGYTPKNKYHEAIIKLVRSKDRVVIKDKAEAIRMRDDLVKDIRKLNAEYPRCKDVRIDTHSYRYANESEDLFMIVFGVVSIKYYAEA